MDIRLYDGSSLHVLPATIPFTTSVRVHVWGGNYSTYTLALLTQWWISNPNGQVFQSYKLNTPNVTPGSVLEFIGAYFSPWPIGDYQISVLLQLKYYTQVMGEESWAGLLLTSTGAAPTEPEFGDFGIQDYSRT